MGRETVAAVMRLRSDPLIVGVGVATGMLLFAGSWWFLRDSSR